MARQVKYEHKSVKTIRGSDNIVASKMAKSGWELVDSDAGLVSTTLDFRRPKKSINWPLIGGGVAVGVALVAVIGIGAAGDETKSDSDSKATPSSSTAPSDKKSSNDPGEQDDPDVLTVETSADLAAVLAGPAKGPAVRAFSRKYRTRVVELDAFVADLDINPREAFGQSTIRVRAGNASDPKHTGPVFQLSWYGHDSPMEKFSKGSNVRVRALLGMVYEFAPHQFFLVDEDDNALTAR